MAKELALATGSPPKAERDYPIPSQSLSIFPENRLQLLTFQRCIRSLRDAYLRTHF